MHVADLDINYFPPAPPCNSLSSDRGAIEYHAGLLHRLAAGCSGHLVLTPIVEGFPPRPQRFMIGRVDRMVAAIMAYDGVPGVNLYAGYHTMRHNLEPGKRGGERDVEWVLAGVVDVDNDAGKGGQAEIPLAASYVVSSSPGNFQCVYIFPKPLTACEAKPVLAALHAAIGGDVGQKDIAHVWRIPGTLNWPSKSKLARGRSPEPARVTIVRRPDNG